MYTRIEGLPVEVEFSLACLHHFSELYQEGVIEWEEYIEQATILFQAMALEMGDLATMWIWN